MTTPPVTPVLDGLRAEPGGFGQPSFAAFSAALTAAARAQAAAGSVPPVLLVMGEPLAGKSTFLSQLFVRLTVLPLSAPEMMSAKPIFAPRSGLGGEVLAGGLGGEVIRPYLVRWGDTIRAAKQLGDVAQERQFGDLTPDEFGRTSRRLAEAASAARDAARGGPPALVVVEAPGITMVTGDDGQPRGLDRGYTLARELAQDDTGFLLVLCADRQIRDTHLGRREAQLGTGGPTVREATQLAANRIRQQVTDLVAALATEGKIALPARADSLPVTPADLEADPDDRNEAVRRAYLPYLLGLDLKIPPARAFIGLNGYHAANAAPDTALLDAYDWTHQYFGFERTA